MKAVFSVMRKSMYSSIDPWEGIDIHDCVKRKCADRKSVV